MGLAKTETGEFQLNSSIEKVTKALEKSPHRNYRCKDKGNAEHENFGTAGVFCQSLWNLTFGTLRHNVTEGASRNSGVQVKVVL